MSYALVLRHANGVEEPRTEELPHGLRVGNEFELDDIKWRIVGSTPDARDYGLRALNAFVCDPAQ